MALISNGEVKASEVAVLEAMRVHEQLGLSRKEWHDVVHELCIDLLGSATHGTDCRIGGRMIEQMLADIDDVALQRLVLRLCTAVVNADGKIDDGESIVVLAAIGHWGLHPDEHELLETPAVRARLPGDGPRCPLGLTANTRAVRKGRSIETSGDG